LTTPSLVNPPAIDLLVRFVPAAIPLFHDRYIAAAAQTTAAVTDQNDCFRPIFRVFDR
jgi:hypothetical protein